MAVISTPADGAWGLTVHRSAWVDELLDPLTVWLHRVATDPMVTPRIIVQSQGMRRWLSHRLAERVAPQGAGVLANVDFDFPGRLITGIVDACATVAGPDGGLPSRLPPSGRPTDGGDPWDPDRLVWSVARAMVNHGHRAPMSTITSAIIQEQRAGIVGRASWQLARSIADVFNGYTVYRADTVAAWVSAATSEPLTDRAQLGDADAWQPWLWRTLVDELGDPIALFDHALAVLADRHTSSAIPGIPRDIAVFGLTTLPPRHLSLLKHLSGLTTVEWFVPTPSPARCVAVEASVDRGEPITPAQHPIVAASGRLLDDATQMFAQRGVAEVRWHGPRDTVGDRRAQLLATLQRSLLTDTVAEAPQQRVVIDDDDRSVQIHSCHGLARQAQVLRDALLALLADDPSLEPRDIIVLAPDVEQFAPLITHAFAAGPGRPGLPVRVADRHPTRSDPLVEALLAIVRLARGRLSVAEVVDVLALPYVAGRAGLSEDELRIAGRWFVEVGIRWGIDADDRARSGQPRDRHHTWMAGFDRLMLGATMADEDERVWHDVVPYDHMEGDAVELLGRVADACQRLFAAVRTLRTPASPAAWVDRIATISHDLLELPHDDEWRRGDLLARLEPLAGVGDVALDLSGAEVALTATMGRQRGAAGYETGAITLCELVPMRSIPHRVVCLVGLDDGAYPRPSVRPGFDLMSRSREVGDRDRADEDRHLVLEAMLAARDHLLVTSTGWDLRTNEPLPPSVVVTELVETLELIATTRQGRPIADHVTVNHPLHAFSPTEFDALTPRSFDVLLRDAAAALASDRHATVRFFDDVDGALTADDDEVLLPVTVTVDEVADIVAAPLRSWFERRLGVYLREWDDTVDDLEPLTIDARQRPGLTRQALERLDDDHALHAWMVAMVSRGEIPAAAPGFAALSEVATRATTMERVVATEVATLDATFNVTSEREHVVAEIGDRVLVGDLQVATGGRIPVQVVVDPRVRTPARRIAVWVRHLLWVAAQGPAVTVAAFSPGGRDATARPEFDRLLWPTTMSRDEPDRITHWALETLGGIVDLAEESLRRPLLVFDQASHAYGASTDDDAAARLTKAVEAFSNDRGGDRDDVYVQQAFGTDPSLEAILSDAAKHDEFCALATAIWEPWSAARRSRASQVVREVGL